MSKYFLSNKHSKLKMYLVQKDTKAANVAILEAQSSESLV